MKFLDVFVVFMMNDVEVFRSVPGRIKRDSLMITVEDDVLALVMTLQFDYFL